MEKLKVVKNGILLRPMSSKTFENEEILHKRLDLFMALPTACRISQAGDRTRTTAVTQAIAVTNLDPLSHQETWIFRFKKMKTRILWRLHGSRIRHCHCCDSGSIPGPGTSAYWGCSQKKKWCVPTEATFLLEKVGSSVGWEPFSSSPIKSVPRRKEREGALCHPGLIPISQGIVGLLPWSWAHCSLGNIQVLWCMCFSLEVFAKVAFAT